MNSLERVHRRLRGEEVDRAPNFDIYMTRAAHYVGRPLSEYYLDYRALVEANLAVCDDFDLDIVQTLSDPYREAADMGLEVEFPRDDLPVRKKLLLEAPEDLAKLKPVAAADGRRMSDRLDAIRTLVETVGQDIVVMGWVEGALALACDVRGDTNLMTDLYDRPEWVEELLELLVEQQIAFAKEQIALGATMIGLGDAVASLVAPKQYRQFALPYEQRIFAAIKEAGSIPRLHICGDTNHLVSDMAQSGADIVDLDWMVALGKAAETFGADGPAPCGNFDPVEIMLRGTPDQVAEATRACKAAGGPRHFSAAGCEIPDDTPEANMRAHAITLREIGGRQQVTRGIRVGVVLVVAAIAACLAFWPVPIAPAAWDPPKAPELAGPYALNDALTRGTRLLEGIAIGPEDVAFDAEGRLYTGFEDGQIVRMTLPDGEPQVFAATGGRPLGMVFDQNRHLIVADASKGLLSISPQGEIAVLATGVEGRPFGFLNDLDIGPEGTVYVSDASTRFGYGSHQLPILEHGGDGQLLAWDPATRSLRVLLDGLQFANGIVVEPSGDSLLFGETGAYRITRYWIEGERAGTTEVFAANLPGFPDNIARTSDGRIWAPMSSPRHPLADALGPWPFLRKVVVRLPNAVRPDALRHGLVVELAPDGRPLRALHDPSGGVAMTSCAMERDGVLYVGSFRDPSVTAVPLD